MGIKIDRVIRSKRRTIALTVTTHAALVVRAPFYVSLPAIQRFVNEKRDWIEKKQDIWKKRAQESAPRQYVEGEEFYFLGRRYSLEASGDIQDPVVLDGALKISGRIFHQAERYIRQWYRQQAKKIISGRAELYSVLSGLCYQSLRISSAQSRWGSCGYRGSLNFSWRLVMAPLSVIDYVVVHELSHLEHKNHSREFWARVGILYPAYRQERKWLRSNGHALGL